MFSTAVKVLAVRLIGSVIVLVANLIAVRLLGASNYGAAVFILSAVNISAVLAIGGSKKLLVRSIGVVDGKDVEERTRIFSTSIGSTLILLVPSAMILVLAVLSKNGSLQEGLIAVVLLSLTCIKVLSESYLIGCSRSLIVSVLDNMVRPIIIAGAMVAAILILNIKAETAIYLYSVIGTLLVVVAFQLWISLESSLTKRNIKELKDWFVLGLPFIVMSASLTLQNNADIVMLGFMTGDTDAGLYAVASRVSTAILFGLTAVNLVYAPLIAKSYKNKKIQQLQHFVNQSSLLCAVFAIVAGIVALIYSESILLMFGEEFVEAKLIFQILVAATVISALCGPVGTLLTMTNFASRASYVVVVATVINIVLNLVLIPLYGVLGAAVATVCSIAFWNITMLVAVVRDLKVRCGIFAAVQYLSFTITRL